MDGWQVGGWHTLENQHFEPKDGGLDQMISPFQVGDFLRSSRYFSETTYLVGFGGKRNK